jgi:hypothetical protein
VNIYEPSNGPYHTKYFGVLKSDKNSIQLVHSLEPLNTVTIAHSGVPPGAADLAEHFAGWACGSTLNLYSGYNHRLIYPDCYICVRRKPEPEKSRRMENSRRDG